MRKLFLISIAGLLFLAACSDIKKPSDRNFTKAINQYLAKHGQACTSIGQTFPVDVPKSEQRDQYGIGSQMAALEQAGLVHWSNTVVAAPGVLRPGAPRPVKLYELTDEGKKYFKQIPGIFGQNGIFCYGQKTVDKIVKWTEPMTTGDRFRRDAICPDRASRGGPPCGRRVSVQLRGGVASPLGAAPTPRHCWRRVRTAWFQRSWIGGRNRTAAFPRHFLYWSLAPALCLGRCPAIVRRILFQ